MEAVKRKTQMDSSVKSFLTNGVTAVFHDSGKHTFSSMGTSTIAQCLLCLQITGVEHFPGRIIYDSPTFAHMHLKMQMHEA